MSASDISTNPGRIRLRVAGQRWFLSWRPKTPLVTSPGPGKAWWPPTWIGSVRFVRKHLRDSLTSNNTSESTPGRNPLAVQSVLSHSLKLVTSRGMSKLFILAKGLTSVRFVLNHSLKLVTSRSMSKLSIVVKGHISVSIATNHSANLVTSSGTSRISTKKSFSLFSIKTLKSKVRNIWSAPSSSRSVSRKKLLISN